MEILPKSPLGMLSGRPLITAIDFVFTPSQWHGSPDRPIRPMPWFLPLTLSIFVASSTVSRKTRIYVFVPLLTVVLSQTRVASTGNTGQDFGRLLLVFGFLLRFIDFGLLCKDGEIYKLKDQTSSHEKSAMKGEPRTTETFWHRLTTSLEFWLLNQRGIGWNFEVGGLPPRPAQSRRRFLIRTLIRLILSYLAYDLTKYLSASLFPTYIYHSPPRPSFFSLPLLSQVTLTWLHQLESFCVINMPYQLAALIAVGTGMQEQDAWPPLFGNLSDAYLVSKAWGRTWHQLLRRHFGFLTPHIQSLFNITSRSGKRMISLICSFTLSGLYHWVPTLNLPYTPSAKGMFWYFFMQAPVIRIEDYVVEWGRARGLNGRGWRLVGYIWTFVWISFGMRYAAAYQFESGPLSVHEPVKYSVIDWVIGKLMK